MTHTEQLHHLCNKLDAAENENRALREQLAAQIEECREVHGPMAVALGRAIEQRDSLRSALEAAFFEGYSAGYSSGSSDQCSYEWGASKGDLSIKKDKQQAWEESDALRAITPQSAANPPE